jgi:hypothetical protein
MTTRRHIAILFHEKDRDRPPGGYIVHDLAEYWRQWGHRVHFVYGVRRAEPADVLFVHVDLSVVPDAYLELARRYPVTVNARVSDIRKCRISANLVTADDGWSGPVIVKSDLNYGGMPELIRRRSSLEARWPLVRRLRSRIERWMGTAYPLASAEAYEIYEGRSSVPLARLRDRRLVIERFLPELEDGVYHTRMYQFLGDRWLCLRIGSRSPIVKGHNSVSVEQIEPDPGVAEWRKALNMDYGKLDYVVADGRPVLLDANKTIGASRAGMNQLVSPERVTANRRTLAEGIRVYL